MSIQTKARLKPFRHLRSPAPAPRAARKRPPPWPVLGCVAALLCAMALAVSGPGEGMYLAAAASARAGLRYDRALALYAQAARLAPHDPTPACQRGAVLLLQHVWRDAAGAYQECIARAHDEAPAWVGLGDALQGSDNTDGASSAWQRAAVLGSATARRRLGLLDERLGRFDAAAAAWAALPSDDAEARAHLGLLALRTGDFATASQDFASASATRNASGQWLAANGFAALVAESPASARTLALVGYRFLAAGMPLMAIAPLERAITLAPTSGEALVYLGWAEWLTNDLTAARRHIAAGVRLAPGKSFSWYATGELAAADGRTSTALADFHRGLLLDARNPALWAEVGRLSLLRHDYVTGELALESAATLGDDPAYSAAALNLYLDTHLGLDDGRARRAANTALQRWPENADITLLCGEIYDLLGDPTSAFYAFERARTLAPTLPDAYVWLGQYAQNEGLYVEAALDLRIALALRPEGPLAARAQALLAPLAGIHV